MKNEEMARKLRENEPLMNALIKERDALFRKNTQSNAIIDALETTIVELVSKSKSLLQGQYFQSCIPVNERSCGIP